MQRRRLRLVSSTDPAAIFDELDQLRHEQHDGSIVRHKRQRGVETFARIPHDRALELYRHKIIGTAWVVLIELDRLILKRRGQNPVLLISSRLTAAGVSYHTRRRALRQFGGCRRDQAPVPRGRIGAVGDPSLYPLQY